MATFEPPFGNNQKRVLRPHLIIIDFRQTLLFDLKLCHNNKLIIIKRWIKQKGKKKKKTEIKSKSIVHFSIWIGLFTYLLFRVFRFWNRIPSSPSSESVWSRSELFFSNFPWICNPSSTVLFNFIQKLMIWWWMQELFGFELDLGFEKPSPFLLRIIPFGEIRWILFVVFLAFDAMTHA